MDSREEREIRIKRLKRRRLVIALVLVLVLAVLIGGIYLAKKIKKDKNTKAADKHLQELLDSQYQITEFYLPDVTAVDLTNENGHIHFDWIYTNEEEHIGGWKLLDNPDFPTKANEVQGLIGCVCALFGDAKIPTENVDLTQYGISETSPKLQVFLKDGTSPVFTLGSKDPYDTGYYMRYEVTKEVFLVNKEVGAYMHYGLLDLIMPQDINSVAMSAITEVLVAKSGGELISYRIEKDEDGNSIYPTMFTYASKFVVNTIAAYQCPDLSVYGLDSPYAIVEVKYDKDSTDDEGKRIKVPASTKLEIGNENEAGNRYVRIDDGDYVYIMSKTFIDQFLAN